MFTVTASYWEKSKGSFEVTFVEFWEALEFSRLLRKSTDVIGGIVYDSSRKFFYSESEGRWCNVYG